MTKQYVIFLDIDGVFTSARAHLGLSKTEGEMWAHFDPVALGFLNTLDAKHNIDWVLMSTWVLGLDKMSATTYHWVCSSFRNAGFHGYFPFPNWKTEDPGRGENRAHMVKKYLAAERLTYDDFIVIDDNNYGFNDVLGVKRFINTDPKDGMLTKHMMNMLSLTGNWEKKDA
jgi:hypothetical protein